MSNNILIFNRLNQIIRPDFGCLLAQYLFQQVDQGLASDAILNDKTRIEAENIETFEGGVSRGLVISITYNVKVMNIR